MVNFLFGKKTAIRGCVILCFQDKWWKHFFPYIFKSRKLQTKQYCFAAVIEVEVLRLQILKLHCWHAFFNLHIFNLESIELASFQIYRIIIMLRTSTYLRLYTTGYSGYVWKHNWARETSFWSISQVLRMYLKLYVPLVFLKRLNQNFWVFPFINNA